MGATDKRNSKNYRVKPLPIYTKIHSDESLSSWLIRSALNQGSEPLVFTDYYWHKHRLWTTDIDRGFKLIDKSIYNDMSILLNNKQYDFSKHSLSQLLYPINTDANSKGIMNWVIPRSSRNRKHRIGRYFCPCCLQNHEMCYLKNDWRISWNISCLKHRILLQNKCGFCGEKYQPHLLTQSDRVISRCHNCSNYVFENINHVNMTKEQVIIQNEINYVLYNNEGILFNKRVGAHEWFATLRFYINLIQKASTIPSHYTLSRFIDQLGIKLRNLTPTKTGLQFELLENTERLHLLKMAYKLMQVSHKDFSLSLKNNKCSQNTFMLNKKKSFPHTINKLICNLPINNTNRQLISNSKSTPNTPLATQRLWERLKRRYEN